MAQLCRGPAPVRQAPSPAPWSIDLLLPAAAYTRHRLKAFWLKAGRLFLILALVMSAGAHWVVLQGVAWTAMLVENTQCASLVEAVKQTFDGEHPCGLCKNIAAGKSKEDERKARSLSGKSS